MSEALYRKHRSYSFDEIKGQDHITTTLKNALRNNHISHAYLLTGPKGVGKTSVARILAYGINNLEYNSKTAGKNIDIIEIDAASNRRIDEIRDLRDKAKILPAFAKYKVYIIDEAHMLTKEAFNALLKTLEEPPSHVVFILATTEAHKLPETIISRTQRFNFHSLNPDTVVDQLRRICEKENITANDEALNLIAKYGQGSFRDSIGLLDQLRSLDKEITLKDVEQYIGAAPDDLILNIVHALSEDDPKKLLNLLDNAAINGVQLSNVCTSLIEYIREEIYTNNFVLPKNVSFWLIEALIEVPKSFNPDLKLEIVLTQAQSKASSLGNSIKQKEPLKQVSSHEMSDIKPPAQEEIKSVNDKWAMILSSLKGNHNTLYGIARMAKPSHNNGVLILEFKHSFHKKRIEEARNIKIIKDLADKIGITSVEIKKNETNNTELSVKNNIDKGSSDTLDNITNVFGGGEILED